MLNHVGTNIIDTERLRLRRFKLQDAECMFENWAKDPENVKYLEWQAHSDISETRKILMEWTKKYDDKTCYHWCINLKGEEEAIGDICVVNLFEDKECAEIGYVLSKKYWNKGIMTEALSAVIDYLFQKAKFHRIQALHHVNNPASGKVMMKCGMKHEGMLRKYNKTNMGEWCDVSIYSILEEDFFKED